MAADAAASGTLCRNSIPDSDFDTLKSQLDSDDRVGDYSRAFFERDAWGYREHVIRFYVARGGSVPHVFNMVRNSFAWRQENNVDAVREPALWAQSNRNMELLQRYWPAKFIGHDKDGMPVWVERFGHTDPTSLLDRVPADDLIHFHIWVQEEIGHVIRRTNDALPADQRKPVLRHLAIEDLDGLGMKHYHSKGLELFKQCIKLDEANYPERLSRLYVVNAPTVFRMLWGVVKPWLDPRTLNKIEILGGDYRERLLERISEDQLPVGFGGTLREDLPHNDAPFEDLLPSGLHVNEKKITVDRRGQTAVPFRVDPAPARLAWHFTCEGYDIAMGILNTDTDQWIVPIERYQSHVEPTVGSLELQPANYSVVFDNSFSRFTSKTVRYLFTLSSI